MDTRRTAFTDWFWAGGPSRRLLVSLGVTALVLGVPYLAGGTAPPTLVALFIGWDFGAWFMDKVYLDRLARRKIVAG